MKERDNTTVYFIRREGGLVDVFRVFDSNVRGIDTELPYIYGNVEVEKIKPKNIAFLDIPHGENGGAHLELTEDKVSALKNKLIEEQKTVAESDAEIPELIRQAMESGLTVVNHGYAWEITLEDY